MSHAGVDAAPASKRETIIYSVNVAIVFLLIFGVGMLPPWGALEPIGMQVLGIFLGLLYGWTFIGFIWPSIIGLIALGLTGYISVGQAILTGMGDGITVLVLFLFVFAAYLDHIGLSTAIADWFISRKISIGRPWIFTMMIFLAAYVIGATVSLFAGIVLIWNIFYKICDVVGFKRGEKYPTLVLIGIVYSAMLGFAVFPFKVLQVMVLGSLEKVSGLTVNFFDFTLLSFAITIAGLLGYLLMCRFIFKPDVSLLMTGQDHFAHMRGKKLNTEQWIGLGFLVFFMAAMFIPSILPKTTALGGFFGKLGTTGSMVLVVGILAIFTYKGKPLFNFSQMARGINWDMVIMFFATMPVSHAMSDPEVGVMDFIVSLLNPIFADLGPTGFIIAFLVIAGVITQVAHNMVLGALMTPILYSFCVQFGVDPLLMTTLLAFALAVAIATPGGSAPGALIYVNREWINVKSAYGYSAAIALMNLVIMFLVGWPLGSLLF